MDRIRRQWAQLALLVLAVLGAADAIYLTLAHYDSQVSLVCSSSGFVNCTRVITSAYSYVPGTSLPISLAGLGWCLVVAGLAIVGLWRGNGQLWLRAAQFIWTLLGLLTALYLVYVEIVALHNLCEWCTVLHVLILLMFLIALTRLVSPSGEEEYAEYEEVVEKRQETNQPGKANKSRIASVPKLQKR